MSLNNTISFRYQVLISSLQSAQKMARQQCHCEFITRICAALGKLRVLAVVGFPSVAFALGSRACLLAVPVPNIMIPGAGLSSASVLPIFPALLQKAKLQIIQYFTQ